MDREGLLGFGGHVPDGANKHAGLLREQGFCPAKPIGLPGQIWPIRMTSEIAEMVDWSEAEVETIARRYVGAAAIANAILARMRRRT